MKTFLVFMTALTGLSASSVFSAEVSPLSDTGESYYDQLKTLFTSGTKPNLSKITDVALSGRCFYAPEPNRPTAAGYFLRKRGRGSYPDFGPIAGKSPAETTLYEVATYGGQVIRHRPPSEFDGRGLESITSSYPRYEVVFSNAAVTDHEILSTTGAQVFAEPKSMVTGTMSRLRAVERFLIEELLDLTGEVGTYCYYFKPEEATQASDPGDSPDSSKAEVNYFEKLGHLFLQGTLPELSRMEGKAWTGRCFKKHLPTYPLNGGYLLRLKYSVAEIGPIARPTLKDYEAASYASAVFDEKFFDTNRPIFSAFTPFAGITVTNAGITFVQEDATSVVRASGNYLVEEILENGSVTQRCYYFNR